MRSFLLTACGQKNNDDVVIDYGSSEIYTKEDMDEAIRNLDVPWAESVRISACTANVIKGVEDEFKDAGDFS